MERALFENRAQAGRQLADRLEDLRGEDVVVLALPRGGVPVGIEIARRLDADLDVLVVRKIGVPGQNELALAAVGADGTLVVNQQVAAAAGVDQRELRARVAGWADELAERAAVLREWRPPQPIGGRTAVVVDDGIATGASLRAALNIVRSAHLHRLVVAVPVAPPEACTQLSHVVDRVECLHQPEPFVAVGIWYGDFDQVSDHEVQTMLRTIPGRHPAG